MKTVNLNFKQVWYLLLLLTFNFSGSMLSAQASTFKHTATSANSRGNTTAIDHPRTNGIPQKVVFISHEYGSGSSYLKSPIGVWYGGNKWNIFKQDLTNLPAGMKFNVLVQTTADRGVFVHHASSSNTFGNVTILDHPMANNKPNAKILLTQNWGTSGPYNNNHVGVYYYNGRWRIFNQQGGVMPVGAKFNVMIDHSKSFVHQASASSNSHITALDNANINGNPDAFVFATANYGTAGPLNQDEIGVWNSGGNWYLYNEDRTRISDNAKFNVVGFALSSSYDLTGYYDCNDGGRYYIRRIGDVVHWFGESPSGSWANIFRGSISGNTIRGQFYDVPKGRAQGVGALELTVSNGGNNITKVSGPFGGSRWTKSTLPSNLPRARAAGFHAINNGQSLNGAWRGNNNGTYYIRQYGNTVVWFAEENFTGGRPAWSNIAIGTRSGSYIDLNWVDLPKGRTTNQGQLRLFVRNANTLTRVSSSNSSGSTVWNRGAADLSNSMLPNFGYNTMRVNGTTANGARPMLVIKARYRDVGFHNPHTTAYFDNMFFGNGNGEDDPSVVEYFKQNSFNRMRFYKAGIVDVRAENDPSTSPDESLLNCALNRTFDFTDDGVDNPIQLCPGVDPDKRWEEEISKSIALASRRAGFNFSRYDRNGDNIITIDELQIVVVFAEVPYGSENSTYPRTYVDSGANRWADTPLSGGYRFRGAVATVNEGVGFATLVHEISHSLGTHDLYGAASRMNQSTTIMSGTITGSEDNKWAMNMDPYHKMRLGWTEPRVYDINAGGGYAILNTIDNGGLYFTQSKRPVILYDSAKGFNEYFILEARRPSGDIGFDNRLRNAGIMVWRVRTDNSKNPVVSPVILSGENQDLDSRVSGDDIVINNEIHAGADNQINSTRRDDDRNGSDRHVVSIGPPNSNAPLVGRGQPWRTTDGDITSMFWSNGNNAKLRIEIYESTSSPGYNTIKWIVDESIPARATTTATLASVPFTETLPILKGTCEKHDHDHHAHHDHDTHTTEDRAIATAVHKEGILKQNTPNPFTTQTTIQFELPTQFETAMLQIIDVNGRLVEQHPLTPDQGALTINSIEFSSGIYVYALIVDGQLIGSKRMIVADN